VSIVPTGSNGEQNSQTVKFQSKKGGKGLEPTTKTISPDTARGKIRGGSTEESDASYCSKKNETTDKKKKVTGSEKAAGSIEKVEWHKKSRKRSAIPTNTEKT